MLASALINDHGACSYLLYFSFFHWRAGVFLRGWDFCQVGTTGDSSKMVVYKHVRFIGIFSGPVYLFLHPFSASIVCHGKFTPWDGLSLDRTSPLPSVFIHAPFLSLS